MLLHIDDDRPLHLDMRSKRYSGNVGSSPTNVFCAGCVVVFGLVFARWLTRHVPCFRCMATKPLLMMEATVLIASCFLILAPSFILNLLTGGLIFHQVVSLLEPSRYHSRDQSRLNRSFDATVAQFAGLITVLTWFCILFVDCSPFPVEMMKTENFGISLMDVGVASSVFVLGLRKGSGSDSISRTTQEDKRRSRTFGRAGWIGLVGLGRIGLLRATNYYQPISEYGAHWNFLLTVSVILAVWEMSKMCLPSLRSGCSSVWLFAGFLMLFHEVILLQWFDLASLAMSASRRHIVEANKEGLISLPGYFVIFLVAVGVVRLLTSGEETKKTKKDVKKNASLSLFTLVLVLWGISYVSQQLGAPSRRMCNFQYIAYCSAANTTVLWILSAFSYSVKKRHLLERVARNQLITFLAANLLTGLLNSLVNLPELLFSSAVFVVAVYMGCCVSFAVWLDSVRPAALSQPREMSAR